MLTLWIKTKGQKGEDGFEVASLELAKEKFEGYKARWNKIQLDRHEKPYTFTAKVELESGEMIKL